MKRLKLITMVAALAALSACGNVPSAGQSALNQAMMNYNTSAIADTGAFATYEQSPLMHMNNIR